MLDEPRHVAGHDAPAATPPEDDIAPTPEDLDGLAEGVLRFDAYDIAPTDAFDPAMYWGFEEWSGEEPTLGVQTLRPRRTRSERNLRPSVSVHGAAPQLPNVAALEDSTIAACLRLSQWSTSADPYIAQSAISALERVRQAIAPPLDVHYVDTRVFSMGRKLDDAIQRLRRIVGAKRAHVSHFWSSIWTFLGIAASVLLAVTIANPQWGALLAPVILLLRQVLTTLIGGENTLPFEGPRRGSPSAAIYRCWATHFSDVVMLAGFVALGLSTSRLVSWFSVAALAATLLGVIARSSALQVGIQVNRLNLERVLRPWPPVLFAALAALLPTASTWLLCMGLAAGPILYGIGEVLRTTIRISDELKGKRERSVTLSSCDILADGTLAHASRTRAIEIPGGESSHTAA